MEEIESNKKISKLKIADIDSAVTIDNETTYTYDTYDIVDATATANVKELKSQMLDKMDTIKEFNYSSDGTVTGKNFSGKIYLGNVDPSANTNMISLSVVPAGSIYIYVYDMTVYNTESTDSSSENGS